MSFKRRASPPISEIQMRALLANRLRWRLWLIFAIALTIAGILVFRWWDLQVYSYTHYDQLAKNNLQVVRPLQPKRGLIYDRQGVVLARNVISYYLWVDSDFAPELEPKLDLLANIIYLPEQASKRVIDSSASRVYKGKIILREIITEEELEDFLVHQHHFSEVVLDARYSREYVYGDFASHLLGYVGRINQKDKQRIQENNLHANYRGARFIGKAGLEKIYESSMRGTLGLEQVFVDAHGRVQLRAVANDAGAGRDLHLSIDYKWQAYAEELLAGKAGSIVVLDVNTGEILVLASAPRFDSNKFVFGISKDDWQILLESTQKPLIHRAIYGQYAPGSTIKPFLALLALEQNWRKPESTYFSRGYFELAPGVRFHDWRKGGHGEVNLQKSIVRSVNSYYFDLANEVGIEQLHSGLARFGFGKKTGVILDNEKAGINPNREWKRSVRDEQWYPGDTVQIGVGQGYMQVTPLQLARAMAIIASDGALSELSLIKLQQSLNYGNGEFGQENLDLVQQALQMATRPGGTGASINKDAVYSIAGKTGTAQVRSLKFDSQGNRIKNEELEYEQRDHGWFVGYAPSERPQIVVSALVEHGGSGAKSAGVLVRQIVDMILVEDRWRHAQISDLVDPSIAKPSENVTPQQADTDA